MLPNMLVARDRGRFEILLDKRKVELLDIRADRERAFWSRPTLFMGRSLSASSGSTSGNAIRSYLCACPAIPALCTPAGRQ
jgi:hypothetical protein